MTKKPLLIIALVVIGILVFAGAMISIAQHRDAELALSSRLNIYCISQDSNVDCTGWSSEALSSNHDKIAACDSMSPTLDKPFRDCLIGEHIEPD